MNNIIAYIALGSNLNQPILQLNTAVKSLSQLKNCDLQRVSSYYQNPPYGPPQPDYINAVALLETTLSAHALLHELHRIERDQGRIRTAERNSARTLDLDIILYGMENIKDDELEIPHPRLAERPFVLIPLLEISSDLVLPNGTTIKDYVRESDYATLKKVE